MSQCKKLKICVAIVTHIWCFCIENTRKFVNQYKGKITLKFFPWGRMSLAMSCRSGLFQLKTVANKSKNILRVEINNFCDG